MKLQASEEKALNDASLLIKYAAENPKTLPEKITTPIAEAWKAREDDAWSPEVSSKFWIAYSALCDLLRPVTLETISASKPSVKYRKWIIFGNFVEVMPAEWTAGIFRIWLIFLLVSAVISGFIASTSSKMSDDIKELITRGNTVVLEVASQLATIKSELDKMTPPVDDSLQLSLDDSRISADTKIRITTLREKLQDMYYVADVMHERVNGIVSVTPFATPITYNTGDLSRLPKLKDGYDNIQDYYQVRRAVSSSQQLVFILNNLYNALVPALFGAIGACTYVLRLISDQIRERSFSTTSPVRHSVRVLLGALSGFAVGLGGIVTSAGLSAAALAFVSGYAVEPVFATMDGIAEKFRRT
jgi:hypothetical protein